MNPMGLLTIVSSPDSMPLSFRSGSAGATVMSFWKAISDTELRAWERLERACEDFERAEDELAAARQAVVDAARRPGSWLAAVDGRSESSS